MSVQFQTFEISELETMGNPKNPRWMPESQMAALTESLTEFGLVEQLIINTRTKQIVGGHQRVEAAIKAGFKTLEAVIVDLAPDKELALNLLLNKVKGEWDYDKLAEILSELDSNDLSATGFSETEAEAIIQSATEEAETLMGIGSGSGVVPEVRNRTDEEVELELESKQKVQFGMFTRHIPSNQYKAWLERLENFSDNGTSPAALGLVIAQMLGIETLQEESVTEDELTANEELEHELG